MKKLQRCLVFCAGNIERLVKSSRLAGELSGQKNSKAFSFKPALYANAQNALADSFLRQNGYIG